MDARLGNCVVFLQLCLKVQEIILRYPLFLDWYTTISFVCHYKTEKTERNFSKGIIRQQKTLLQTYAEFEQSFSSTNLFSAERTREDRIKREGREANDKAFPLG